MTPYLYANGSDGVKITQTVNGFTYTLKLTQGATVATLTLERNDNKLTVSSNVDGAVYVFDNYVKK